MPEFIQVITDKSEANGAKTRMHLFDTNWNFLKNAVKGYNHTLPGSGNVAKPKKLNPDFPLAGLDNNFVRIKELRKPFSLSTFDVENQ